MTASLSVVPAAHQSRIERIRALRNEIRTLAGEHTGALISALADAQAIAADIADGGDAFLPGVRDLARRIVEDADTKIQTLEAIIGRQS